MQSLQYHVIDARYATIRTAHTKTCRWLLEKPEYQDWLDINKTTAHHGFLWIRGKPGSGKSTIMKFAVGNARKAKSETVISFFFNARGEDLEKSTLGMYRSLLFQILNAIPDLQTILGRIRPTILHEEIYSWDVDDLQSLFEAAIEALGQRRLTCFIDALDECEEGQIRDLVAFLEKIGERAASSHVHFHVCLSSRHYPHISIKNGIQMTLEGQEGHDQDIDRYLSSELKAGCGRQVEAIKEEILRRSSGIFLWVALVVQILNKEYDHGRVHALSKRLRDIPDGLDKLFEEILTRDQDNMEELVLCLQWILYAKRPLKQEEIYYAVLSGTDPGALSVSISENITASDMERFILSCSKGLAETTKLTKLKTQTVQFIHESVRDFLLGRNGLHKLKSELGLGLSHDRLKKCCYDYMARDASEYLSTSIELPVANSEEARNLREVVSHKFPFLDYAVRNVLHHADVAHGQGISQEAFMKGFTLGKWIMLDNLFEKHQVRRHTPHASLLYITAEKNLGNLVQTQVESDLFSCISGERFGRERYLSPLHAALAYVNFDQATVQALFSIPVARSHDSGGLCKEQFDCEIERNRAAIAMIVEKRPNHNPEKGQNLIGWAASNGYEAVVNFLLGRDDFDPNSRHHGCSPLSLAAKEGHAAVVKLLLARNDIDPNSKYHNDKTSLWLAADRGHEAVVKLLIARDDVDLDPRIRHGSTVLWSAIQNGHTSIVKLLLTRDCIDLNTKSARDGTLIFAIRFGPEAVVKLLLARDDIDPNAKGYHNETTLALAVHYKHEAVVKWLLARDDIDPNTKDDHGETPLSLAVRNKHEAVVKLLLAREDIDPYSKNSFGETLLSLATRLGPESTIKLIQAKIDFKSKYKNDCGPSPPPS